MVTAISFKRDIPLLDIVSTRMLGAYGFLSRVFSSFEKHRVSVDVLASSEISVSLTLDKKQKIEPNSEIFVFIKVCRSFYEAKTCHFNSYSRR
jgi:aspartokinase